MAVTYIPQLCERKEGKYQLLLNKRFNHLLSHQWKKQLCGFLDYVTIKEFHVEQLKSFILARAYKSVNC